jgi:phosphate transport system substrate-binding protein
VLATACGPSPRARRATATTPTGADTIRVDGSPGVMPLVAALAEAYRAQHPAALIELRAGLGAEARLQALAEGRIDVAMASHGIDRAAIARRGQAVHEIATVAVVFAVHAGVPVTGLTGAQLCALYSGRVVNWRAVGGPDLAVAPRTRPPSEVDAEVTAARFPCLRSAAENGAARTLAKPDDMARELAAVPGAIGMTSSPFVDASRGAIRALALDGVTPTAENVQRGAYPLTRRSFLVTRAAPPAAVTRFLEFVRSRDGAGVIAAAGAVPIQ